MDQEFQNQSEFHLSTVSQQNHNGHKKITREYDNIVELLESIFSDQYLQNNDEIKQLIAKNSKGFISLFDLLQTQSFTKAIIYHQHLQTSVHAMSIQVNQKSKKLVVKNYKIRRIQPYVNPKKLKNSKILPTYIDSFPKQFTEAELCNFLGDQTGISQIYLQKQKEWCIVFSTNPQLILSKVNQWNQDNNQKIRAMEVNQSIQNYSIYKKLYDNYQMVSIYSNKNQYMNTENLLIGNIIKQKGLKPNREYQQQQKKYIQKQEQLIVQGKRNNYQSHRSYRNDYEKYLRNNYLETEKVKQERLRNMRRYNNQSLYQFLTNPAPVNLQRNDPQNPYLEKWNYRNQMEEEQLNE